MEVIYSKACGIDVHKTFIVAVICDSTGDKPKYIKKRFSTFNKDFIQFRERLLENNCQNVCMESTGKYYISVYNALEGFISNVVVANPKWATVIKGEKDDNKDAKWIADLFKMGIVRSSFIPSKDFRIIRELTRYIYKLTCIRSSEKNRYINALTVGNCKLDMVFSDIFGKSSQEDILASVSGITFTTEQKLRIKIVEDHIDYLTNQINILRNIVDELINPYEDYINLRATIPGINRNFAIAILSEIGTDMSQFKNHYRLASWAGLAPGCNESAGKKKFVKISRAGVYLKPCLVEVAHCAVKSKTDTYYANKFEHISKRRGKKHTFIAISRKILVAIYHMLSNGEAWYSTDLASNETSDKDRLKSTKNDFNQSLKQLLSFGLISDELIDLINQNAII